MSNEVFIQNLKCGGCKKTITTELGMIEGISKVNFDEKESKVVFDAEHEDLSAVLNRLNDLGYPPVDDDNSLYKKARSYVSCMIGRVS